MRSCCCYNKTLEAQPHMTVHIFKVSLRPEISVSSSLARSTEQVPHPPVLCSGRPCLTTKNHKTLERGQVYKMALSFGCRQSKISSLTDSASGSGITVPWQESVCKKNITKEAGRGRDSGVEFSFGHFLSHLLRDQGFHRAIFITHSPHPLTRLPLLKFLLPPS